MQMFIRQFSRKQKCTRGLKISHSDLMEVIMPSNLEFVINCVSQKKRFLMNVIPS